MHNHLYINDCQALEMYIGSNVSGCHILEMINCAPLYFLKTKHGLQLKKSILMGDKVIIAETLNKDEIFRAEVK